MTIKEAILILDPETSEEALQPYAYDSHQRRKVVDEACRVAVDELRKRQWISVKDRLPENRGKVLIYSQEYGVREGFYDMPIQRFILGLDFTSPTHWQPMPEPPKEREENA